MRFYASQRAAFGLSGWGPRARTCAFVDVEVKRGEGSLCRGAVGVPILDGNVPARKCPVWLRDSMNGEGDAGQNAAETLLMTRVLRGNHGEPQSARWPRLRVQRYQQQRQKSRLRSMDHCAAASRERHPRLLRGSEAQRQSHLASQNGTIVKMKF